MSKPNKTEQNKVHYKNWYATHKKILDYIDQQLRKYGSYPTQEDIAKNCKVSRTTVCAHLDELSIGDYITPAIKARTKSILLGLAKAGSDFGNAASARLFFKFVWGWIDPEKMLELEKDEEKANKINITDLRDSFRSNPDHE